MKFKPMPVLADHLLRLFGERIPLQERTDSPYRSMRWPAFPPLMRFETRQMRAEGFGHVFVMNTRAMGGLMQLMTLVFTPGEGGDVPLLLIDAMAMGKKRAAFVEYYDCTKAGSSSPEALQKVAGDFSSLPDYPEKPAWYIGERTDYSLIKGGANEQALADMLEASVRTYAETAARADVHSPENRAGLKAFIDRMVREGNPSSPVMNRVLGEKDAEIFFRTAVLPLQMDGKGEEK